MNISSETMYKIEYLAGITIIGIVTVFVLTVMWAIVDFFFFSRGNSDEDYIKALENVVREFNMGAERWASERKKLKKRIKKLKRELESLKQSSERRNPNAT